MQNTISATCFFMVHGLEDTVHLRSPRHRMPMLAISPHGAECPHIQDEQPQVYSRAVGQGDAAESYFELDAQLGVPVGHGSSLGSFILVKDRPSN